MKKRLSILLMTLLATALFFIGCGNKNDAAETDTSVISFEQVKDNGSDAESIYVVLREKGNAYWDVVEEGVRASAAESEYNVFVGTTDKSKEWSSQQVLLKEAIEANPAAIVMAVVNSQDPAEMLAQARSSGIPVILIDTIVNNNEFDVIYMTNNVIAGENAAEKMLDMWKQSGISENDKAQVGIEISSTTSQTVLDRMTGFSSYWTANAPANWTIIDDIKSYDNNSDVAIVKAKEYLNDYADIKGVFGTNTGSTNALVKALVEDDRKDISIVGFDYGEGIASLIKDEAWSAATMVQRQYDMGYQSVITAAKYANGEVLDIKFVDTGVSVVDNGNYTEYDKK